MTPRYGTHPSRRSPSIWRARRTVSLGSNDLFLYSNVLKSVRSAWRHARELPIARGIIGLADRIWWARTIRRARIVDDQFVAAQLGGRTSARAAVRHYVSGGFRDGFSLNPLVCERTISRQLSDSMRVPALYAYLVNDRREIQVSPAWDAPRYAARIDGALEDSAGPLGHAWRRAEQLGTVELGRDGVRLPWTDVKAAAVAGAVGQTAEQAAPLTTADVVFVVQLATAEPNADEALSLAAEVSAAMGARVTLQLQRPLPSDLVQANLLAISLPGVNVVVSERDDEIDAGAAEVIVVRGPHAVLGLRDVELLTASGRERPTAPLWLAPDGTVASAGVVFHAGRALHLLAGHPVEDALRLGPVIEVPEIAGSTRAWPAARRSTGPGWTLTGATVTAREQQAYRSDLGDAADTDIDALLASAGLIVADCQDASAAGPTLARAQVRDAAIPLRWAIKTAAPAGRSGQAWGDTHFAQALAAALRRQGQEVVVDAFEARDRPSSRLDDITIVLRGPHRIAPPQSGVAMLWIISHPDEIIADELAPFHRVFAASVPWARSASERFGMPIRPLLQCTDGTRFRPTGAERGDDIVFVGTARGIARPSVVEPLRAGIPVRVYGPDWRGFIPGSAIAATSIPNRDLPALYERSKVVLNDHWPAMAQEGFISNRPYDVVAAGGRVISDAVEGIETEFAGAVLVYRSVEELIALLEGDMEARFPREVELQAISARIRAEESFDARARVLIDAARTAVASTPPGSPT